MALPRFSAALLRAAALLGEAVFRSRERLCRRGRKGRLLAEIDALRNERLRLLEENRLLRGRLARLPGVKRPRYRPWERFRILWHKARHGLSLRAAARAFVLRPSTIQRWAEDAERSRPRLSKSGRPLRSLEDLVKTIVHRLKREQVDWGTRRIAMVLSRLGLACSRSSVQRILRRPPPKRRLSRAERAHKRKGPLVARHPNHVWLSDLTEIRLLGIPLLYVGAAIDLFSRKVVAVGLWRRTPTARQMARLIRQGIKRHRKPRHLVTDQGRQFTARAFKGFLRRRGIRRRYGAVRSSQSVAVIERFWRTFKGERGSALWVFLPTRVLHKRIETYVDWYNRYRPHWGLQGKTPDEVFFNRTTSRSRAGSGGFLRVRHLDGDEDLPIYWLEEAA